LSLSKAALSIAQAELRRIDTLLSHCVVQAPFAGVITAKPVQAYQFVAKGGPLLDMINTTKLEVEMILPSRWLVEIRPGTRFSLLVDETGSRVDARVDRIVSQVDPVSQTVRVIGVLLDPPTPDLLPGMSGNIHFLTDQVVPAR
jgi:multidrug efflux pump subunit AcrA (membrane-fusion protein)